MTIMGFQYNKEDTYTLVTRELEKAYGRQRSYTSVISGEYEVIKPTQYLSSPEALEPENSTSQPKDSGMTFHVDVQDSMPLTEQLLAQSKGQNSLWQLRPKAPASQVEKKFNEFLKVLADRQGCTPESLKKQGFNCQTMGEKGVSIDFPNKDIAKLFQQMLNENLSAAQVLKPAPSMAADEPKANTFRP